MEHFREYHVTNLLEGDFFSWYCSEKQWTDSLAEIVKNIFEILCRYSEKAVLNNTSKSQDFFKLLSWQTMDASSSKTFFRRILY